MTLPIMISRSVLCLLLAVSPFSLGITDAAEAEVQVYKCTQPNGSVLYTDLPCKGGSTVDLRLGPPDPAAPARLARAQAELDAAAAQNRANEEMAAARREELIRLHQEAEQGPAWPLAEYPYEDYGPLYGPSDGYPHRRRSPSEQPRERATQPGRVVPSTERNDRAALR
jgi:hypothetical protein